MPREDTPVKSALKSNKENVLYILFRDLNMSISVGSDNWLPNTLYKEASKCEIKKCEQNCKRMELLAGEEPGSLLQEFNNALNGIKYDISRDMMLCISGYGLVLLLNKFREHTDFNRVIDDVSGFTMLHVSALYGKLAMVQYLLFNGAYIEAQSKDGFTAAHVAAMKGQRECVAYLHAYQSRGHTGATQDTSIMPISAEQLAEGYEALVKNFTLLLLPEEYGLDVLSEPQEGNKVKLLLQKKMEQLNISDNNSFKSYIADWRAKKWDENVIDFYEEVKETLSTYKFKCSTVWRSYPCIALEKLGVSINLVWYAKGITWQVKVLIVPVLKNEYPEDTDALPPLVTDCLQKEASVYITKTKEKGKWTYVMTQLEDMISSRLAEEKQFVLSACKFLNNVLEPWWFPRLQSKRHGRVWHSYAISIGDVPDQRQILTLFLKEVTQTEEKDWVPSKFLERVISIYSRSKCNGDSNGPHTVKSIRIFLDPKHGCFKPSSHISAIVDVLGSLQMEVY